MAGSILSTKEKKALHQVVLAAEANTTTEIHIAFYQTGKHPDVLQEAIAYFKKIPHHPGKNLVLIYILENDRRFAILGDEEIHKEVPENYWDDLSHQLTHHFKQGHFYLGLVNCINQLGQFAKTFRHR